MNKRLKLLPLICLLALFATVGGAYGAWHYRMSPPAPVGSTFSVTINEFLWPPEEVLPDNVTLGESHTDVLNAIVDGGKDSLNGSKNVVGGAIEDYEIIFSQMGGAGISGGNLKKMFTTEASRALEFVMTLDEPTNTYHLYTFEDDDINSVIVGTRIPVYKTFIEYVNGEWEATGTMFGDAEKIRHPNGYNTIDIATWTPGIEGQDLDAAMFSARPPRDEEDSTEESMEETSEEPTEPASEETSEEPTEPASEESEPLTEEPTSEEATEESEPLTEEPTSEEATEESEPLTEEPTSEEITA